MPADAALLAEIPFFHFLDDGERVSLASQLEEVGKGLRRMMLWLESETKAAPGDD